LWIPLKEGMGDGSRHEGRVTFHKTLMSNKIQLENGAEGRWFHLSADTSGGPEWTSTHQCTNVDGWCTDRILFSIPVPSQVWLFLFALSQPWSEFLFWDFYFLHAPFPVFILFYFIFFLPGFFFFFSFETFPTHPPTTPHCPPPTYSPIYLN
jgi:hypothetical protein